MITKQLDEECSKDVVESLTHTSYHVTVKVNSNKKSSKAEPSEAPQAFKDWKQATADELKELNLGTNEDPRPIYVSMLLSPFKENLS